MLDKTINYSVYCVIDRKLEAYKMSRRSIADIRRRLAYAEYSGTIESLAREKVELASFIDRHSSLEFDQAWDLIEMMCTEILPGYRGIGKLMAFRNEIRDRLKKTLLKRMEYEEWLKEQMK